MEKQVLVFGATGKTGKAICQELANNKISYSVFARKESTSKLNDNSIDIYNGNVLEFEDVEKAINSNLYTDVIITLGSKDFKSSNIRSIGTKHIIDAINKSKNASHIHVISALGIGESWNQLKWHAKLISNLLIKNTMNDHSAQEKHINESKLKHHIIRPVGLKDGESKGKVMVQNQGFLPSNSIQREDLAKFIVQGLIENRTGVSGVCQSV